jgi:hypothetical protein
MEVVAVQSVTFSVYARQDVCHGTLAGNAGCHALLLLE